MKQDYQLKESLAKIVLEIAEEERKTDALIKKYEERIEAAKSLLYNVNYATLMKENGMLFDVVKEKLKDVFGY